MDVVQHLGMERKYACKVLKGGYIVQPIPHKPDTILYLMDECHFVRCLLEERQRTQFKVAAAWKYAVTPRKQHDRLTWAGTGEESPVSASAQQPVRRLRCPSSSMYDQKQSLDWGSRQSAIRRTHESCSSNVYNRPGALPAINSACLHMSPTETPRANNCRT